MKGFEIGKRVRVKEDLVSIFGDVLCKQGSIVTITDLTECCDVLVVSFGIAGETTCAHCNTKLSFVTMFWSYRFFDPIDDDEMEIHSDTFKQVTFTKIIENVPAGVN